MTEPNIVLSSGSFNGQFIVSKYEVEFDLTRFDGKDYEYLVFQLRLQRKPEFAIVSLLLPMIVIGLLCPLSFLIPPENEEKVSVSLQVLLSTTICIGSVRSDLPDKSDQICTIVIYVVCILIFSFLGVFGNILVLLVHCYEVEQNSNCSQTSPSVVPATTPARGSTKIETISHKSPRHSPGKARRTTDRSVQWFGPDNAKVDPTGIVDQVQARPGARVDSRVSVKSYREDKRVKYVLSWRLNLAFLALSLIAFAASLTFILFNIFI